MDSLESLIREYCGLLDEERRISDRKDELKAAILKAMGDAQIAATKTQYGSVDRASRFKLTPRREPVLSLLDSEDLFPFAQFTPAKVTEHLVPRYGRERLLPLFDVEKTEYIQVRRPQGSSRESAPRTKPTTDEPR